MGLDGMPDFLRMADVVEQYEQLTGYAPRDMRWYFMYSALRHGIVMFRIGRRQALFGESTIPENPDDMIPHRPAIEAMMEGNYWDTRR